MNKTRLAVAAIFCTATFCVQAQEKPEGYTCCNLHYDKEWISDANWRASAMIPAGARIKVLSYDGPIAGVEIDGKPYRVALDYSKKVTTIDEFMNKLVVKHDPRPRIERAAPKIRESIKQGRAIEGMTREEAILAVGYPSLHKTPTLDSPVWQMWTSRAGRYEIHWGNDGKIERLVGSYY